MSYAVVTPARNEVENLPRLAESLVMQSVSPSEWVIVDDGSTDGTLGIARGLASDHEWITAQKSSDVSDPRPPVPEYGRRTAKEAAAFEKGVSCLRGTPDVIVKLDADVSLPADFFERLLAAFEVDPALGIAGGLCFEKTGGEWRPRFTTGSHVRGATRAYRRQCLQEVTPLEHRVGWDGIDSARANAHGWSTYTIRDLPFRHHRKTGERDRGGSGWATAGETLHFMGYRPSYLLLKAGFRTLREPAAAAMIWGYIRAAKRREPQCSDEALRNYVREQQRLRRVWRRASEALGHGDT